VFIYDKQGTELHCLKKHAFPYKLEFLQYHFLLCSIGKYGVLRYQDTTNGKIVSEHKTKLGHCNVLEQNPFNAVLHLGHNNGCVTFWSPNSREPLVKMLCHKGPINSIAIDTNGIYMASSGNDGTLKIWDVRTYKELQSYYVKKPVENITISQRGILSISFGPHVQIWKDYVFNRPESPYMVHKLTNGARINSISYCPFEDVLGIGHSNGYSSIIIPGAGEPNFDTFEANPFETKKQRRESTVHKVLEKIPSDMISLDPLFVGKLTDTSKQEYQRDLKLEWEANNPNKEWKPKNKNRARGRSTSSKKVKRKKLQIIQHQKKINDI